MSDDDRSSQGLAWRTIIGGVAAGVGYAAVSRWRDGAGSAADDPTDRVLAGPSDDQPEPGERGRVYLATDSGERFLDTGSAWEAVDVAAPEGSFETVRATDAITARSPVYDVRAWGATGDGEHDDTRAIQRVLDAAEDAGGGVVRFPPGEYYTTHTLLYGSETHLTGQGATIAFEPADPDATALVSRSFDGSTETRSVTIEGLAVESVDPEKGNGIGVAKAQGVTIRGCRTDQLYWHLVDVAGAKDVSVRNCYAANLGTAAYQADNLTEGGGLVVEHPDGSTEGGISDGTENENVDIESNIAEDCARGVHLHRSGGHDLTVRENKFRRCTDAGILGDVDTHWHDVIVSDNILEGDGTSGGIDLQGEYTNLSVEDNTVRDHERGITVKPGDSAGGRPGKQASTGAGTGENPPAERTDTESGSDAGNGSDGVPDDRETVRSRANRSTVAAGVTISDNTIEGVSRTAIALAGASGHVSDNYVHVVGGVFEGTSGDRALHTDDSVTDDGDDRDDASDDGGEDDEEKSEGGDRDNASDDSDTDRSERTRRAVDTDHVGISVQGCDGMTITDNVLRDVSGTGVLVWGGSCDVVVSENNVNGFEIAVSLRSAGDPIEGADVKDNRFVGRSHATWAVDAEGGSGFRIEDNAIAGVGRGAVRTTRATDVHVGNNDATGNDAVCGYAIGSCSDVELHDNTATEFETAISLEAVSGASGRVEAVGAAEGGAVAVDEHCRDVAITFVGTEPPETGAFGVGSRVRNAAPAPGDPVGWVCVDAGVPGTWKPYGEIWF